MIERLRSYSGLVKPELPLAAGVCVVAGQVLVLGDFAAIETTILGFLVGFFLSGSAMISNDYFDLEVDRVNRPERPLPSGRVTVTSVRLGAAVTVKASPGGVDGNCPAVVLPAR